MPVSLTRQPQLTSLEFWGNQSLERADHLKIWDLTPAMSTMTSLQRLALNGIVCRGSRLARMWMNSPLASLRQLTALELLFQDSVKDDENPAHILSAL